MNNIPAVQERIIGHRGASGLAPENTAASFKKAKSFGLNWVEFDVQATSCGELVIIHDNTLDRTTNGNGLVNLHNLEDIKRLDAGSWFSELYKDEKILTLEECLTLLKELCLYPNIEVKCSKENPEFIADKLLSIIESVYTQNQALPLVSSFDNTFSHLLRSIHTNIPVGYLTGQFSLEALEEARTIKANTFHCDYKKISHDESAQVLDAGFDLMLYTVNNYNDAQACWANGALGVFSDRPDFLLKR